MIESETNIKCYNDQCTNQKEDGYDLCKNCIQQFVRICTCNKTFITENPVKYVLGKRNGIITILQLPDPIPDFFFTGLKGNLYHIFGCRGCQHTETISVQNDFNAALQASILSCVYQRIEEDGNVFYEYLSDSLDPVFEQYIEQKGIKVGEPAKIVVGEETNNTEDNGNPGIEIPI